MTRGILKTTVGVVSIAIVAVIALLTSNLYLSADAPTLEGEDVITHDWGDRFSIENGVKSIQKGERIGNDCRFTMRLERALGEPPMIARGLAVKVSTCEKLIEKGTLSEQGRQVIRDEESRADGSRESNRPEQAGPTTDIGRRGPGLNAPLMLPSNQASYKTRWEDPVNLDVNWVKSWVDWDYDAPNSKVYYNSGLVSDYWLGPSGWFKDSGYFSAVWYYFDSQQRIAVEADDHFYNDSFCGALPRDHAYYQDNRIVGTWSGIAWGESDSWVSGGCSYLLHDEYTLE